MRASAAFKQEIVSLQKEKTTCYVFFMEQEQQSDQKETEQFLRAWNVVNRLLPLDYEKVKENPELAEEAKDVITTTIEAGLKSEKDFPDAVHILNLLAANYSSPDTMILALEV